MAAFSAGQADAQEGPRDEPIRDLPRPGYEPRLIRIGATIIAPELEIGQVYDSNVFATSRNEDDDMVFRIAPTVKVTRDFSNGQFRGDAWASLLRYVENGSENTESFGGALRSRYILSGENSLSANVRYDRTFERRTDPEANPDITRPPSDIDILQTEIGYEYRTGRIGVSGGMSAVKVNYLEASEADKDQITYRSSIRGLVRISGRLDAFVEAYANRRDARTAVDRSGVDRDTTTWAIQGGARVDIADRLQGEFGLGYFRANPDDPRTANFSGISANGRLTWRPQVRTAVTAEFFNGDVATIRQGANGRVDTRFSLRVDQEARHNLILRAGVSLRNTSYRGQANNDQLNIGGELGAEYLFNRYASVMVNVNFADRSADQPTDEFEKVQFGAGVRLRF